MFNGAGAESLCCKAGAGSGYATEGGAGANLAPVNQPQPQSARTINAHDVPFPLDDPYSPVRNAGIPIPGYTAWPRRANRLGRKYYGLDTEAVTAITEGATSKAGNALAKAFAKPAGFAGMGAFDPIGVAIENEIGPPPVYGMPPIGTSTQGGINWNTFFGGLFKTLPATISAVTGKGDPLLRTTNQGYALPPTREPAPDGYSYNSSGQLVKDAVGSVTDFVSSNPLLVGGAILGVVLLFMKSPSGRR